MLHIATLKLAEEKKYFEKIEFTSQNATMGSFRLADVLTVAL